MSVLTDITAFDKCLCCGQQVTEPGKPITPERAEQAPVLSKHGLSYRARGRLQRGEQPRERRGQIGDEKSEARLFLDEIAGKLDELYQRYPI